ncbi:unnamed protein product [Polarella glacialis]|uniref:Uncharacterized protein n=1 Tax=Polarella glacialis TaxID=89957 RepID=A0A813J902_POLGL|nr:unnamed protein product [Polarella glacialis]
MCHNTVPFASILVFAAVCSSPLVPQTFCVHFHTDLFSLGHQAFGDGASSDHQAANLARCPGFKLWVAFSTRFAARAKAFGASEELEAEADSKTCRQDQQRTKKKRTRNEKKQQLLHQKLEQLAAQQAEEEEEEPQTLLGLQEPLDKEGYRRAADLVDPEAMVVFLRRLLDSQGGKSLDDSDLLQFACRCSVEDKGFGEVMLLLGLESWTSDTSGAAGAELQLPPELELPPPPPAGLPEGAGPTMFQVEGVAVPAPSGAATLVAELPLEPRSGSVDGGTRLQWTGQGPAPLDLYLAGRPCAALRGGAFVVPLLREQEQERGWRSSRTAQATGQQLSPTGRLDS